MKVKEMSVIEKKSRFIKSSHNLSAAMGGQL